MERKSLYSPEAYQEVQDRINGLTKESQPRWGKMSVAQMLAHCAEVQDAFNGTKELEKPPLIARLFKGAIRKAVVGDKPYKQGLPTAPQYLQTEQRDFDQEKHHLLSSLEKFVGMSEAEAARLEHPLFGRMNREERGWSMYKHLDHHLTQFGA